MSERGPFTISPGELEARLGAPDLRVVDASWYLPAHNRDRHAEFAAARIPGAAYFDIDAISDRSSPLPHMLAGPEEFAAAVGAMGISENDDIVVYDGPGLLSAARAWWNFRIMGGKRVRVLDGGFDRWKAAGRPVETGPAPARKPAIFTPDFDASRVKSIADMRANLKVGEALVLDARPFARFTGEAPEPRPGLRSGHIPGARSLPVDKLTADGRLKDIEALKEILSDYPLEGGRPAITSCGSGVTAAVITLALETAGHANNALYDGSWAEWGQAPDAPVATWEEKK